MDMPIAGGSVAEKVASVCRRIAGAAERAGRDPAAVRLVAVTKTFGTDQIDEVLAAGVNDIGENRVQEAVAKAHAVHATARWHLIGHLQTNKAGRAAALFDVVHSIDGLRVAQALSARRPHTMRDLDVLIEVELTGIAGHTGARPEELASLVTAVARMERLRLRGLMTMAPPGPQPQGARPVFAQLRRLGDEVRERTGEDLPELSMGMSDDFEVAIEEGSTMVRIGRAIFGERPLTVAAAQALP